MKSTSSIALSGVSAATTRLGTAAHNIAIAQTPGARRQVVTQAALVDGGVSSAVGLSETEGGQLATDVVEQRSAVYAYRANLKSIETQDQLVGSILDETA